jgi:hypothetical protein
MNNLTNQLEDLIDQHGLSAVMDALADVCRAKADHVAANWQDETLALRWEKWPDVIEIARMKLTP